MHMHAVAVGLLQYSLWLRCMLKLVQKTPGHHGFKLHSWDECIQFYSNETNGSNNTICVINFLPQILLRLNTLPYWSKPPFLIFDIWALWRSVLSTIVPECQKLKMVA